MSRKCPSAQKTEKYNQGKHGFVWIKLDHFALIFQVLIYAYYLSIRDHCLLL